MRCEEKWLPIEGFPGYEVSDLGRIKSTKFNKTKILASVVGPQGYLNICIHQKRQYLFRVHKLVAETFLGKKPEGCECRHLDGNKLNNNLSNLRWGTRKENVSDMMRHGTYSPPPKKTGESAHSAKLTQADVEKIRSLAGTISGKKLAMLFGVNPSNISAIIRGKIWSHLPKKDSPKFIRRGSEIESSKLTEAIVSEIHMLSSQGYNQKEIANMFGVCRGTIGTVIRGEAWKHVSKFPE